MANNTDKILKADMHTHSDGSFDGMYPIDKLIGIANKNNVHTISVTDHNNFSAVKKFCLENNLSLIGVLHKINGINFIPGVEITCVMPNIINNVNYKTKFHLLVYGARMDNYSPLAKLLKLKRSNDELVDYGLLKLIAKKNQLNITSSSIKEYVIQKRGQQSGFGRFGAQAVVDYLNYNNLKVGRSERSLFNMLKTAPVAERLELNIEDVIKLAHASGGVCILAHPKKNLDRTEYKQESIRHMLKMGIDGFEIINNSMNEETFKLIMEECKNFNSPNKLLFTGGSDLHYEGSGLTVGSTYSNVITKKSQQAFIDEMYLLDKSRSLGVLTHRDYKYVSDRRIDTILQQYSNKAEEYEKKYASATADFTFDKKKPKPELENEQYINPEDYNSLEDYVQALLKCEAGLNVSANNNLSSKNNNKNNSNTHHKRHKGKGHSKR